MNNIIDKYNLFGTELEEYIDILNNNPAIISNVDEEDFIISLVRGLSTAHDYIGKLIITLKKINEREIKHWAHHWEDVKELIKLYNQNNHSIQLSKHNIHESYFMLENKLEIHTNILNTFDEIYNVISSYGSALIGQLYRDHSLNSFKINVQIHKQHFEKEINEMK